MGLVDERQGRDILGLPEIMAAAPKLAERTVRPWSTWARERQENG